MSRINRERDNLLESIRLNNTAIQHYIHQENQITNQGYIDNNKMIENTRILSLNSRGMNP